MTLGCLCVGGGDGGGGGVVVPPLWGANFGSVCALSPGAAKSRQFIAGRARARDSDKVYGLPPVITPTV